MTKNKASSSRESSNATTAKDDLLNLIEAIDAESMRIPRQRFDWRYGHRWILRQLAAASYTTSELFRQWPGKNNDRDHFRQRLRDLRRVGLVASEKQFLSDECDEGPYENQWSLCVEAVKSASLRPPSTTEPLDDLRRDRCRALHEADWSALGIGDHLAWRLANVCAALNANPTVPTDQMCMMLVVDRASANAYRRHLIKIGFLKKRVKQSTEFWEVQWPRIFAARSRDNKGRRLAPTRAVTRLAERHPDEDRRTDEQRMLCEQLDAIDVGIGGYQWGAAKVLFAAIGEQRYATREELACLLGGGRRSIDRALPILKNAELLTVKPHAGGDDGRKSLWVPNWQKLREIAARKQEVKPAASGQKGKPEPTSPGGLSPKKRNLTCDWVARWRTKNPRSSLEQARLAYLREHPQDNISYDALKKAIKRRRRGMLKTAEAK